MKAFETPFTELIGLSLGRGYIWRYTATESAWEDPPAYLESRGVANAAQQQPSTRTAVESATSTCIVTVTQ